MRILFIFLLLSAAAIGAEGKPKATAKHTVPTNNAAAQPHTTASKTKATEQPSTPPSQPQNLQVIVPERGFRVEVVSQPTSAWFIAGVLATFFVSLATLLVLIYQMKLLKRQTETLKEQSVHIGQQTNKLGEQVQQMKSSGQQTEKLIEQSIAQTEISRGVAEAAKRSADASLRNAQAFIASERPWVAVTTEFASVTHVFFKAKSYGRIPAKIIGNYAAYTTVEQQKSLPSPPDIQSENQTAYPRILASTDATVTVFDYNITSFTHNEPLWKAIHNLEKTLYFYGKVLYTDAASLEPDGSPVIHETRWCYEYMGGTLVRGGPAEYNDFT